MFLQLKRPKGKHMELTITQNGALYFAHHKVSKQRRTALFWPLRTAASKQGPQIRRLPDSGQQAARLLRWVRQRY
jgi:hypothetical protein